MIARRGGDDAATPLLLGEHADAVVSAAQFECTGDLEVFEFEIGGVAGEIGEVLAVYERGLSHNALELFCGGIDARNPCR
jgi:hypothetical protein